MTYQLTEVPNTYDTVEPYSSEDMTPSHPDENHQACLGDLQGAQQKLEEAQRSGDIADIKAICNDLANRYSRHLLDSISLANTHPDGAGLSHVALTDRFEEDFGSWEPLTQKLLSAAHTVQGSGWAVLAWQPSARQLVVLPTEKYQNLSQWGVTPILALDVWKDAYYLWLLSSGPTPTR
ncbi:MAG: Fe-Mn family superoxide dismutase [Armatimonadota bacterium]